MSIDVTIPAFAYPGQEAQLFSITLLPAEPPASTPVPEPAESFCSFCLRVRPLDGDFCGYNVENCPILRATMEDIFGTKFQRERFSICTPCWKLMQLMDDFRHCCFEAHSCIGEVKGRLQIDDGWFTGETLKTIESMHIAVRDQIERIKHVKMIEASEKLQQTSLNNDVITIDDDSNDEFCSTNAATVDRTLEEVRSATLDRSEEPIEMPREEEDTEEPMLDLTDDNLTIVEDEPEEQDQGEEILEAHNEVAETKIKVEVEEPADSIGDEFPFEEQNTPLLDRADYAVTSTVPEISVHNIKAEPNDPEEMIDEQDHQDIKNNDELFTEISVESIKVEKNGVGEKIAQLVKVRVNQCGRCGEAFCKSRLTHKHMKVCRNQTTEANVMYTCQICWASFRSRTNFKSHTNMHASFKPYKCRLQCRRFFFGLKGRIKHEQNCTASPICSVCENYFRDKESLFAHIKAVHGTLSFKCETCLIRFDTKMAHKRHIQNMHTERECDFSCKQCKSKFKTAYEANMHLKECVITYDCDFCDLRLPNASDLKAHKKVHKEKKYGCELCDEKFTTRYLALQHKKVHSKKPRDLCPVCQMSFSSPRYIKRHMKVCGKEHTCPYCSKKISTQFNLKRHIVYKHPEHVQNSNLADQVDHQ